MGNAAGEDSLGTSGDSSSPDRRTVAARLGHLAAMKAEEGEVPAD
jgi:hypothetical protein